VESIDAQTGSADFRSELDELRQRWSEEDLRDKISNRSSVRLADLYRQVDPRRRDIFDEALSDWIGSDDPGTWFDGFVLISEFKVRSALPAVNDALERWTATLAKYEGDRSPGESRSDALRRAGFPAGDALSRVDGLSRIVEELGSVNA